MKRVMFVDDEPQLLAGLRDLLRVHRREWEMSFVGSGREAIERLESDPCDVVVTDMRMPGMDGAELLRRIQSRWPGVVRIVLSGHTEMETTIRTVPIAHQYLAKPCEPERLREVVHRACSLQALLVDEELQRRIGGISSLPSVPRLYSALVDALASPDVSPAQVAGIVEKDMAMAVRVLQMVNSAFFGLPRRIASVRDAVHYLGTNAIKNLVLSIEAFRSLAADEALPGLHPDQLRAHGSLTGRLARSMLADAREAADAAIAATLHEVGVLILATRERDRYRGILADARARRIPLHKAEDGIGHAEVGGYLLGLWGIPFPIVEAVAFHHAPGKLGGRRFGVAEAVHTASAMLDEVAWPELGGMLDPGLVERCGIQGHLAEWRGRARAVLAEGDA